MPVRHANTMVSTFQRAVVNCTFGKTNFMTTYLYASVYPQITASKDKPGTIIPKELPTNLDAFVTFVLDDSQWNRDACADREKTKNPAKEIDAGWAIRAEREGKKPRSAK
jgi:hypothetical protein